jgi:hypothetical protein
MTFVVLEAGHQAQRRRRDARPIDDFERAPMYDAAIEAGSAAKSSQTEAF